MIHPNLISFAMLRAGLLIIGLCLATPCFAQLQGEKPVTSLAEDLIHQQLGELPIIISAPHGGNLPIPDAKLKQDGTTARDMRTEEIALELSKIIENRLGQKPHHTIARFSRKYIDANRGPGLRLKEAYSGPEAKKVYEQYHQYLANQVEIVRQNFGNGILIDLHGQSSAPHLNTRGTMRGLTVKRMLEAHGIQALVGPNSIFGQLQNRGYPVEPRLVNLWLTPLDEKIYTTGYIIMAYGSHNPEGIDAILVELGRDYRSKENYLQTTRDLADSIIHYYRTYLQSNKPTNP